MGESGPFEFPAPIAGRAGRVRSLDPDGNIGTREMIVIHRAFWRIQNPAYEPIGNAFLIKTKAPEIRTSGAFVFYTELLYFSGFNDVSSLGTLRAIGDFKLDFLALL